MNKENNKNNLKVGDSIFIEDAWEDEAGGRHDEEAEIQAIDENGLMTVFFHFASDEVNEFLKGVEYPANDYQKI